MLRTIKSLLFVGLFISLALMLLFSQSGHAFGSVALMVMLVVCLFGFIILQVLIWISQNRAYKARLQRRLRTLRVLEELEDNE